MYDPGMGKRRVVVAGAGIGGLALAGALRRIEDDVVVLERVPDLRPIGAGIVLGANAILALRRMGLGDEVVPAGAPLETAQIRDWRGRVIQSSPLGALSREMGAPTIAFHRAELHEALLRAASADTVRLGCEVTGVGGDARRATATLADGTVEDGDLVVGADGLHSRVRERLLGPTPLVYSGQTSWRGVTGPVDLLEAGTSIESWGPGRRFGMVALAGRRVYWFAVADAAPGATDRPESVRDDLALAYRGWHEPVTRVIEATSPDAIIRTDIFDRDPVARWTRDRVTLLGDAAHPMTPNLGQGAGQAVEDALVLCEALARSSSIDDALRAYERKRIPRTTRVVADSRELGRLAHWRHPAARWLRNQALRMIPPRAVEARLRRLLLTSDVLASPPPDGVP
jgi:2-polyprenyl-6-methoxyphenol hydroxylase-like FAD-dependent oxidoreductase